MSVILPSVVVDRRINRKFRTQKYHVLSLAVCEPTHPFRLVDNLSAGQCLPAIKAKEIFLSLFI